MTRHLSLAEFWYLAEHVTGIKAATLIEASRVELADSALHAPQAGFGDTDFSPDVYDKAAVECLGAQRRVRQRKHDRSPDLRCLSRDDRFGEDSGLPGDADESVRPDPADPQPMVPIERRTASSPSSRPRIRVP